MTEEEDYVIIWEAPKLIPPEYRLYYDDKGKVICYSGDKSVEGKYIVIDIQAFIEARPDLVVVDGKISRARPHAMVSKLMPDDSEGVTCHPEDMSIIVDDDNHIKWKLNLYEL